jgi:hypothetical protein
MTPGNSSKSGRIPTLICVDVEPTDRAPELDRQHDWNGFEEMVEQVQVIRPDLEDATGSPAHFSWFLRIDPQITFIHGSPGWVVPRYLPLLTALSSAGDEIGLHIHPWRWDGRAGEWVADFADVEAGREAVRCGFNAFHDELGFACRSIRFGDRWLNRDISALAARLGARFDLTPEPGMEPEPPPEAHLGSMPDYSHTPTVPYRPSLRDPTTQGHSGMRRRPWMIPLTTFDYESVMHKIASRRVATSPPANGSYAGFLDSADCDGVTGWAYDPATPDAAVTVVIHDGTEPVATVAANEYRPDLQAAGVGDGRHGFSYLPGSRLRDGGDHTVSATVLGTSHALQGSPISMRCEPRTQRFRTLDLGYPFAASVLDDILDDPEGREHLALVVRSSSAGQHVGRALEHLARHPRSREFQFTTPQEAMAGIRSNRRSVLARDR